MLLTFTLLVLYIVLNLTNCSENENIVYKLNKKGIKGSYVGKSRIITWSSLYPKSWQTKL